MLKINCLVSQVATTYIIYILGDSLILFHVLDNEEDKKTNWSLLNPYPYLVAASTNNKQVIL